MFPDGPALTIDGVALDVYASAQIRHHVSQQLRPSCQRKVISRFEESVVKGW